MLVDSCLKPSDSLIRVEYVICNVTRSIVFSACSTLGNTAVTLCKLSAEALILIAELDRLLPSGFGIVSMHR